jgi:hypothetical protein
MDEACTCCGPNNIYVVFVAIGCSFEGSSTIIDISLR